MTYPVSNLKQAYNACNPDIPLPVGDVRYLDLTAVRGEVRDLMRLIRLACLNAQTAQQTLISSEAVEQAIRSLVREFDRLIQEKDIVAFKVVAETQRVTGEEGVARLLHNRVIHEYQNGERWADLHPAVREIKWVMEKIQSHDSC